MGRKPKPRYSAKQPVKPSVELPDNDAVFKAKAILDEDINEYGEPIYLVDWEPTQEYSKSSKNYPIKRIIKQWKERIGGQDCNRYLVEWEPSWGEAPTARLLKLWEWKKVNPGKTDLDFNREFGLEDSDDEQVAEEPLNPTAEVAALAAAAAAEAATAETEQADAAEDIDSLFGDSPTAPQPQAAQSSKSEAPRSSSRIRRRAPTTNGKRRRKDLLSDDSESSDGAPRKRKAPRPAPNNAVQPTAAPASVSSPGGSIDFLPNSPEGPSSRGPTPQVTTTFPPRDITPSPRPSDTESRTGLTSQTTLRTVPDSEEPSFLSEYQSLAEQPVDRAADTTLEDEPLPEADEPVAEEEQPVAEEEQPVAEVAESVAEEDEVLLASDTSPVDDEPLLVENDSAAADASHPVAAASPNRPAEYLSPEKPAEEDKATEDKATEHSSSVLAAQNPVAESIPTAASARNEEPVPAVSTQDNQQEVQAASNESPAEASVACDHQAAQVVDHGYQLSSSAIIPSLPDSLRGQPTSLDDDFSAVLEASLARALNPMESSTSAPSAVSQNDATADIAAIFDFASYDDVPETVATAAKEVEGTTESVPQSLTEDLTLAPDHAVPHDIFPPQLMPGHHADLTIQSQPMLTEEPAPTVQGTVTPAEVFNAAENDSSFTLMPSLLDNSSHGLNDSEPENSQQIVTMGQGDPLATSPEGLVMEASEDNLITLPLFQSAKVRDRYNETLKRYKPQIQMYSACHEREDYQQPDTDLVEAIDQLFVELKNLCDYPAELVGTSLEDLPALEKSKLACNSNAKCNFVYEFLQGITQEDTKVLIIARNTYLLRILYQITKSLKIECICQAIERDVSPFVSAAKVTLALPREEVGKPGDYDVVIGYDESYEVTAFAAQVHALRAGQAAPLRLLLVHTHTIQHIDRFVTREIDGHARRHQLLYALVRAMWLVKDPDASQPEPHEIARVFVDRVNGVQNFLSYEETVLPDMLFRPYESQGSVSDEADITRKRKNAFTDDENKRIKLTEEDVTSAIGRPPVPDDVRGLLDSASVTAAEKARTSIVEVPLAVLQGLVGQFNEMKRQIDEQAKSLYDQQLVDELEKQLKSYKSTQKKIHLANRAALDDCKAMKTETAQAKQRHEKELEQKEKELKKSADRIEDLESQVRRLTGADDGQEETPLHRSETLLKETREKAEKLEKRLQNAHHDAEYTKTQYQEASSAAGAARSEAEALRAAAGQLEEEASARKLEIQRINNDSQVRVLISRVTALEDTVKERDETLDRLTEDLRMAKSSRRDTRQNSVPRSPRMGFSSPRNGGGARGTTSRGASPPMPEFQGINVAGGSMLPGMQVFGASPANGRSSRLRD